MATPIELRTERLLLRPWRDTDRDAFAAMSVDHEVMQFFPSLLTRAEADAGVKRSIAQFATYGWGYWAVEIPGVAEFIGFVGIKQVPFTAHFTPAVDLGWRLARAYWGQGLATEAARAAIKFGFETLGLSSIVSYTAVPNVRSIRVMERLGMTRDVDGDFDHPLVPPGHWLRRHVLYRLPANH